MKKLFALLVCVLLVFALVSCGDVPCQHRDADDNSLCDKCGESYTDGKDIADSTPCQHRDADDNSLCDKCGESYTDGKDLPDEHTHDYTVKNIDSKYLEKAADCENAATYFYSCSCGDKGTETFTSGSEKGHSYTVKNTDSKYLSTVADCENAATYFYSCSCGAKGTETFAAGAPYDEHNVDGSGYCTICDTPFATTEGIIYGLSIDRTYAEVIDYSGDYAKVIIASEYNGVPVKTIYNFSFSNKAITSVLIPDSVTSIGSSAFYNCTSLTSVTIGDSVTSIGSSAFYNCTSLTSVTIPDSVTTIGSDAFYSCSSLTSVTIRVSVTSIGSSAFEDCSSLTSVVIPDSVTSIGYSAFRDCTSLTSVTIPDSVTTIGELAFYDCSKLVEVINHSTLNITAGSNNYGFVAYFAKEVHSGESKVINADDYLFYTYDGITYLLGYVCNDTELVLPEDYNGENYVIYDGAFYHCSKLTSVVIPDSVTSIGSSAFSGCSSLESITLPFVGGSKSATSASSSTLFGYIFGTSSYTGGVETKQYYILPSYSTSYYIPSSLKSVTVTGGNILYGAFSGCSSLTSVTIGDSVTSICERAFSGCSSLRSVTIGDSVTSIGSSAFYYCTSLTSVTIPDSVTSIGSSAFEGCSSLRSVVISDSVTSIGDSAFCYCTSLTSIKYRGTQSQWNSITKVFNWNSYTGNYTITYNYGGE